MTAIPGTGTPTSSPTPSKKAAPPSMASIPMVETPPSPAPPTTITTISSSSTSTTEVWYMRLNWWMAFGTVGGVLLTLLGIYIPFLLWLAPFGPPVGAIAWYIQKKMKFSSS